MTKDRGYTHEYAGRDQRRCHMVALLVSLLMMGLFAGCKAVPASSIYENPEAHVSLRKPGNWDVAYYERNGRIVLESKHDSRSGDSARVEVWGGASIPPIWYKGAIEQQQLDIQRIQALYELDSISIIQPPTTTQVEGYEITRAIIGLQVAELPDDAVINQVGGHEPGVIQTIDIRIQTDRENGCIILVYLYTGNSEVLNAEAEGIIESIRFTCP